MLTRFGPSLIALFSAIFLIVVPARAQQHRATRLGNPATRFANPLTSPADLQNMLRSEALRADVDFIAKESGYRGDLEDLRRAASTNNIRPLKIPVGTRLPAMSTRKNGKPVLLRDVLWAGREPIDAYEFLFTSNDRRYRVVSPKACANFWVEDQGRELHPALLLACGAPNEVPLHRAAQVCLTVMNVGDDSEALVSVTMPIPAGASFASASSDGQATNGSVGWTLRNLGAGASNQVCVTFDRLQPGNLSFMATAKGIRSEAVLTRCETRVVGIPAVLLELVDLTDPIEVGSEENYELTVFNQGTADLTNVGLLCTLEDGQQFVSGTGPTPVQSRDRVVIVEKLPALTSKSKATWNVIIKALHPGDVRFVADLSCDQFQRPIRETESTHQY